MRVRDIIHRHGPRLRVGLSAGYGIDGPLVRLSDPAHFDGAAILLDLYAAELLSAFLMSARLARVGELADERSHGDYPLHLSLSAFGGQPRIILDQQDKRLALVQPLWDRLFAELQLVLAHGRSLDRMRPAAGSVMREQRLLH